MTVIVCTRDRPELLQQCLDALSRQTYPNYDVLVVDNAPGHAVREICRRWHAEWVPAPVPGLTKARNVGARAARGDLIAYIDDDAIAEAGWLEALAKSFRDPTVAAVSGRVRYMNAIEGTRAISDQESPEDRVRPPAGFDRETPNWFSLACFGGIGDGGNMAFRRAVIGSSVAFDERLGRGRVLDCGDEHVVFASLIAHGFRIVHTPAAVVRHPCPATAEQRQAKRLRELRSSIAYVLFLACEFPAHRRDIFLFLRRAAGRRIAPAKVASRQQVRLPRGRSVAAMLGGLVTYCMARREWNVMSAEPEAGAKSALPRFSQGTSSPS